MGRLRDPHAEVNPGSLTSMPRKKPPRGPVGSGRRQLRRSSCHGVRHEFPRVGYPAEYRHRENAPSKDLLSTLWARRGHGKNIRAGSGTMLAARKRQVRAEWNRSAWSSRFSGAARPGQILDKAAAATWLKVGRHVSLSTWVPELFLNYGGTSTTA